MKVVLDTNVFVSGLMFPDGVPGQIVAAWSEAEFEVASSREQLAEIARVLAYPKIRRILNWDNHSIERFVERLYLRTEVVELGASKVVVPRDPDDAPMLNTLIAAAADFLVTGDHDLLVLNRRYPIETPSEFIRRL